MIRSLAEIQTDGIEAVTFDVGGTLITPWPSVGHVYARVAARHGLVDCQPEVLNARFKHAWRSRPAFNHTRAEWAGLVDFAFEIFTPVPPSTTFFDELYDHFTEATPWHMFEDVLPALGTLKSAGLKLGVISNWDERLHPLLKNLGLDHWFHAVIVSCDVAAPKPAPVIFQRAAAALSVPPDRILHVGDESQADLEGALAAGFRAELLQRQ